MRFESPWMFLLLPLLAATAYYALRKFEGPALRFPSILSLQQAGASWRTALLPLPPLMRVLALALLAISLARPQMGVESVRDYSRGIAIEMVVDRSSSMGAEMRYQGRQTTRLDVVKRVFQDFVDGAGELPGRPNDLIGMITFARYPDTVCPLTLSHDTLQQLIANVELVDNRAEDGTAIGDAVALAAARLRTAEQSLEKKLGEKLDYEIKSKIIILLTDGENNAGERSMTQAGELTARWDVKVYTIGVGADRGIRAPFGTISVPKNPPPLPDSVDWDLWIGVAPMRPYGGNRVYHPWGWRDWQDFGNGALGDFGCHILDPVFTGVNEGAQVYGKFLKDYRESEW